MCQKLWQCEKVCQKLRQHYEVWQRAPKVEKLYLSVWKTENVCQWESVKRVPKIEKVCQWESVKKSAKIEKCDKSWESMRIS